MYMLTHVREYKISSETEKIIEMDLKKMDDFVKWNR